jgi:hypothetical protein
MRRSFTIVFSLTFIVFSILISTLKVSALAEENLLALQDPPDLTGKNIYFSEGFGEPSQFDRSDKGISRYASLLHLMGANLFVLDWRQNIPENADLVVIPGPTKDFSPEAIARLWVYIERGGHLLLFADALDDKGNPSQALKAEKGLFSILWGDFGIRARDDVMVEEGSVHNVHVALVDANGASAGEKDLQIPVLSVNFQASLADNQNPISQGLIGSSTGTPLFSFSGARSIQIDTSFQNNVVTPLIVVNKPNTYGETNYADYLATGGAAEYNIGVDTARGPLFLAAAVENQTLGSRIVLIGDGDFVKNGVGFVTSPSYSGAFVYPAEANFMVHTSAWLLDVAGSNLSFPTPAPTSTATITPTVAVVGSPTVVISVTSVASPTQVVSTTSVASSTAVLGGTLVATATQVTSATPVASATIAPTCTLVSSPTRVPSATPIASATPEPSSISVASATSVSSPTLVASFTPTATPTQ